MLGTCVQDRLHNLWALVQNENMGLLLVQKLLRISKWQAEFQPSLCPSKCGAHAACPAGAEGFSLKNRFPVCLLPEKSLRFQMSRGWLPSHKVSLQFCGPKAASGGCREKFKH